MRRSVLMIEDDPDTESIARYFLTSAGFMFSHSPNGLGGLRLAEESSPDVIILDLSLPDVDGTEVCRRIRVSKDIPIVMLTGRDSPPDKLTGFDFGADDYMTKPFSPQELVARVKAILRRTKPDPVGDARERILSYGDVTLDASRHTVEVAGQPIHVTATEMRLLVLLMKDPGRVVSREEIMGVIHGNSYDRDPRTVDSHVSHLRRKLQAMTSQTRLIQSVYGLGYRFAA